MVFGGINYVAIVIAALASFGFGAIYYMALAKPWLASLGQSECASTSAHTRRHRMRSESARPALS